MPELSYSLSNLGQACKGKLAPYSLTFWRYSFVFSALSPFPPLSLSLASSQLFCSHSLEQWSLRLLWSHNPEGLSREVTLGAGFPTIRKTHVKVDLTIYCNKWNTFKLGVEGLLVSWNLFMLACYEKSGNFKQNHYRDKIVAQKQYIDILYY